MSGKSLRVRDMKRGAEMIKKGKSMLFKIVIFSCILLVSGFVFLVITFFVGNPISSIAAKNRVQRYIQDVYSPDGIVEKSYYSAKNGYYVVQTKIDNEKINFKYSSNFITDEKVEAYYQKRFDNDYIVACQALMENTHLEFPANIFVLTSVITDDDYNSNIEKLHVQQKMYLMGIRNYDKVISENDSNNMASKIASQLLDKLGDQYNFKSIQMNYVDKFGAYEIVINNKALTLDQLSKHTIKLDVDNIGEEEKVFIEKLNK